MSASAYPVDEVLADIVDRLRAHPAVVLCAPTGSGKTTRVAPALLDARLASPPGGGEVIVLEPRRVAARAAARRIAFLRGGEVGDEVGYQVRFEQKCGPRTRLRVVTDGVFLRMLQDDPCLEAVGCVVLDEFHERRLSTDLALGMLRRIQETVRPDLKLVVMSATLDQSRLARYFSDGPVIESQGRLFPVTVRYAPQSETGRLADRVREAVLRLLDETLGDLLVFLPGVGEIRQCQEALSEFEQRRNVVLMPLYGELPAEQQDAVLSPSSRRKIVLATNVAETSITIEGVTAVIDTGLARTLQSDPRSGLNRLVLGKISKASADQRAGRAGRLGPGLCERLWTEREHAALADRDAPEIDRVDLSAVVLQLADWGERDVSQFPWLDAPAPHRVAAAVDLLGQLGALDERGITPTGRAMLRFPVDPRLARMLIAGQRLGVGRRCAHVAALLSERDILHREPSRGAAPRGPALHTASDVLLRLQWLEEFHRHGAVDTPQGSLHRGTAFQVSRVRDQLQRLLDEPARGGSASDAWAGLDRSASEEERLRFALLCGFPDRVARRREPESPRAVMTGGRGVRLAFESTVRDAELFVCVDLDGQGTEALVRQASAIEAAWLSAPYCTEETTLRFDEALGRFSAIRQRRYHDLVLAETPVPLPEASELAEAMAPLVLRYWTRAFPDDDKAVSQFVVRVQSLREWRPELQLPLLSPEDWRPVLPQLCHGCRSFDEVRRAPWLATAHSLLTREQQQALSREAPERVTLPNGKCVSLRYEPGRPPVLAVRIQDAFGLRESPRVAGGRVKVLLHLLAPNMRPQQITDDLASFWSNTYSEVRKELRRRYPKHAWPENPLERFYDDE